MIWYLNCVNLIKQRGIVQLNEYTKCTLTLGQCSYKLMKKLLIYCVFYPTLVLRIQFVQCIYKKVSVPVNSRRLKNTNTGMLFNFQQSKHQNTPVLYSIEGMSSRMSTQKTFTDSSTNNTTREKQTKPKHWENIWRAIFARVRILCH